MVAGHRAVICTPYVIFKAAVHAMGKTSDVATVDEIYNEFRQLKQADIRELAGRGAIIYHFTQGLGSLAYIPGGFMIIDEPINNKIVVGIRAALLCSVSMDDATQVVNDLIHQQ